MIGNPQSHRGFRAAAARRAACRVLVLAGCGEKATTDDGGGEAVVTTPALPPARTGKDGKAGAKGRRHSRPSPMVRSRSFEDSRESCATRWSTWRTSPTAAGVA